MIEDITRYALDRLILMQAFDQLFVARGTTMIMFACHRSAVHLFKESIKGAVLHIPPVPTGDVVNRPHDPCTFLDMAPNWLNGQCVLMTTRDLFPHSRVWVGFYCPMAGNALKFTK